MTAGPTPPARPLRAIAGVVVALSVGVGAAGSASPAVRAQPCPVTVPNRSAASGDVTSSLPASFNYGGNTLRVALYWPRGTLTAGILPDGGVMATINRDGSIWAKLGWWRGVPGTLVIRGRRLDGAAAPLRADIPRGYGATGFQATGIVFPTVGCWQVVGRVGRASLTFVVKVTTVSTRAR